MKLLELNKKGNIGGLQAFIMGIIGVTIVLAVGFIILAETRDATASCTTGYTWNSSAGNCYLTTNNSITASELTTAPSSISTITTKMGTVPNWLGIIIVVALAAIVMGYFYFRSK